MSDAKPQLMIDKIPWILEVTQEGNYIVDRESFEKEYIELTEAGLSFVEGLFRELEEHKKTKRDRLVYLILAIVSTLVALYATYTIT